MNQLIKIWLLSVSVSLLICFGISELFFSDEGYFWYIVLIYLIVIPLINFMNKLLHVLLTYPLTYKSIVEGIYQSFIDAKFPVLSENLTKQYDWEEYFISLMEWPDASRQQVIASANLFATVENTKTQGMLSTLIMRSYIKKAYLKYMKNNRNSIEEHKAFAGYLIDPTANLDDLDLS
jgi:hypothetical protein